jgi:hypothetical protein
MGIVPIAIRWSSMVWGTAGGHHGAVPWFQPVPKQLNPLHDQQTLGFAMPKPYPTPVLNILHVLREESVQAARASTPKCAGCSDQVGTKVGTPGNTHCTDIITAGATGLTRS